MPIYDVDLSRRDEAATTRDLKVARISAACARDAVVRAIEFAVKNNADWADATVDNTDAKTVARN